MIRLTILLIFGIGITFILVGEDPNRPQGSDLPGGVEVTRLDRTPDTPVVPTTAQASVSDVALSIPLNNQRAALDAALRATEAGKAPALRAASADAAVASGLPAAPAAENWYVTGTRVNLRAGPSTSDAVIGQVTHGQEATVLEETPEGWFRIRTADGATTGFIFGKFLSREEPL